MSDLVRNPDCLFSHVKAHIYAHVEQYQIKARLMYLCASSLACEAFSSVYVPRSSIITLVACSLKQN